MENFNQNKSQSRSWGGLALVLVGVIILLKNIGFGLPYWVLGWYTVLIVVGLVIGAKRNFTGSAWIVLVGLGLFFNLREIPFFDFNISKYMVGIALVGFGIFLITKPKNRNRNRFQNSNIIDPDNVNLGSSENNGSNQRSVINDYLNVVTVFGGSNQTVYSKSFKGGEVTAVFGGADINFVQADFNGNVFVDVTAAFGGIKFIIPRNWAVKSNVTAVFGSVEDKRVQAASFEDAEKTLVLEGIAMFGGVEIKSY
jgi:predicted membrane protein